MLKEWYSIELWLVRCRKDTLGIWASSGMETHSFCLKLLCSSWKMWRKTSLLFRYKDICEHNTGYLLYLLCYFFIFISFHYSALSLTFSFYFSQKHFDWWFQQLRQIKFLYIRRKHLHDYIPLTLLVIILLRIFGLNI